MKRLLLVGLFLIAGCNKPAPVSSNTSGASNTPVESSIGCPRYVSCSDSPVKPLEVIDCPALVICADTISDDCPDSGYFTYYEYSQISTRIYYLRCVNPRYKLNVNGSIVCGSGVTAKACVVNGTPNDPRTKDLKDVTKTCYMDRYDEDAHCNEAMTKFEKKYHFKFPRPICGAVDCAPITVYNELKDEQEFQKTDISGLIDWNVKTDAELRKLNTAIDEINRKLKALEKPIINTPYTPGECAAVVGSELKVVPCNPETYPEAIHPAADPAALNKCTLWTANGRSYVPCSDLDINRYAIGK